MYWPYIIVTGHGALEEYARTFICWMAPLRVNVQVIREHAATMWMLIVQCTTALFVQGRGLSASKLVVHETLLLPGSHCAVIAVLSFRLSCRYPSRGLLAPGVSCSRCFLFLCITCKLDATYTALSCVVVRLCKKHEVRSWTFKPRRTSCGKMVQTMYILGVRRNKSTAEKGYKSVHVYFNDKRKYAVGRILSQYKSNCRVLNDKRTGLQVSTSSPDTYWCCIPVHNGAIWSEIIILGTFFWVHCCTERWSTQSCRHCTTGLLHCVYGRDPWECT